MHNSWIFLNHVDTQDSIEATNIPWKLGIMHLMGNYIMLEPQANTMLLEDLDRLGFPVQSLFLETAWPERGEAWMGDLVSTVSKQNARKLSTVLRNREKIIERNGLPISMKDWRHKTLYRKCVKFLPALFLNSAGFTYWNYKDIYDSWSLPR